MCREIYNYHELVSDADSTVSVLRASVCRSAFHFAISVSVATRPRRARSIRASFRNAVSIWRFSASCDSNALSAPRTSPKTVTSSCDEGNPSHKGDTNEQVDTRNALNGNVCRLFGYASLAQSLL